ncbi:MAG TPA: TCR/Tet family MFS transporter [Thermoanaerobaculia bacterium]|nr:TCR/Tet family MFS transporter [Thermoanaerobaculia bacterium]
MTASKPTRRAAMIFILITLFLDILGIGIIIPILPQLVRELAGGDIADASRYYGLIGSTYALTQFFCAPILGAFSDRFGRRPILLASLFGLGIDYIIQGLSPNLAWLFVGRVIAGVMGASITTVNAYIADISTPETRARNYGLLGVAFGLGFICGPTLGGLLGSVHLRLPFFVSAGLCLLNWLYGYFVLPESLPRENRSALSLRKANPLSTIGGLGAYPMVAGLAVAFVFVALAQRGLENVWVLYTGYRFDWGPRDNGLALGLVGVMAVLVQGLLVRPAIARLGERRAILFGMTVSTVTFLCYGLATQGWMMLVIIVCGAIGGIAGPAIQGLVAGSVPSSEQGKVQGALTSLMSLTSIVAPLIFTAGLFGYFTSERAPFALPGAPFYAGSLFLFTALLLLFRLFRRLPADTERPEPIAPS